MQIPLIYIKFIIPALRFLFPVLLVAKADASPIVASSKFTSHLGDRGLPWISRIDIGYSYYPPYSDNGECQKYQQKRSYEPVDKLTRLSPVPNYDTALGGQPDHDWCECVFDDVEYSVLRSSNLVYEDDEKKIRGLSNADTVFFSDVKVGQVPQMMVAEDRFKRQNKDLNKSDKPDIQVECHEERTAKKTIPYHTWGVKGWPESNGKLIPVISLRV
ncbi:hypothetical protein J3R30DRAFT_3448472 [Lentinula aciculospora]|uniref:Uncharacterized protein n=1 Tax=Lentinula aciculospora TaxID=153920 RepID=A0A9W9AJW4_9AGAR|nr:hypothetical protein J3R30DRAFT_3448472 [Lentinula aciculospora]